MAKEFSQRHLRIYAFFVGDPDVQAARAAAEVLDAKQNPTLGDRVHSQRLKLVTRRHFLKRLSQAGAAACSLMVTGLIPESPTYSNPEFFQNTRRIESATKCFGKSRIDDTQTSLHKLPWALEPESTNWRRGSHGPVYFEMLALRVYCELRGSRFSVAVRRSRTRSAWR